MSFQPTPPDERQLFHLAPGPVLRGGLGIFDRLGISRPPRLELLRAIDGLVGHLSADGLLVPNSTIRLADVLDGTSNTALVAEASNFSFRANGTACRTDGSHLNSWMTGTSGVGVPPSFSGTAASIPGCWNITTFRHPPNSRCDQPGVHENHGANNPLSSAHTGMVQMVMADGAVHAPLRVRGPGNLLSAGECGTTECVSRPGDVWPENSSAAVRSAQHQHC